MKAILSKTLLISALLISANAYADTSLPLAGIYFGLQAGQGNTHYTSHDFYPSTVNTHVSDAKEWAGRVYAGYQIYGTPLALELGYTYFTPIKASSTGATATSGNVIEQALDFVGKGTLPLGNNFNAYGKLGAAYLMANSHLKLTCTDAATCTQINNSSNGKLYSDKTQQRLWPTVSIGLSYNITPRVPVDISWTRIQKVGGSDLKSTDLIGLGIAYTFGE